MQNPSEQKASNEWDLMKHNQLSTSWIQSIASCFESEFWCLKDLASNLECVNS